MMEGLSRKMPRTKPAAPTRPLRYRIGKLEGKDIDVAFTDGTRKELPAFSATGVHFLARDVTGPVFGKTPFEFGMQWGKDATLRGKGWAVPTPLALDAEIQIRGFDLGSAGPYVDEEAQVVVAGGRLDATLAAALQTRNDKLGGTFRGSVAVRSLEVLDRKRGQLLAWDALTIDGIQGNVDPTRLQVGKVALAGLRANIVMDGEGHSNLPPGAATKDQAAVKGGPPPKAKQGGRIEEMRIDEFLLTKGTIDFTDRSVPGDFHAQIRDIDVRLSGMSTAPGKMTDVRARLVMPKGAPLTITGKAAPLKDPPLADLDLVLDGLDLTTATPYAGTYLGLEIDKGTLTVKSRAKLDQGTVAAENRIRVEHLTYGKSVKSDRATILPVQLLTDILRNRDGDIVFDLPVSAKPDDEDLKGTITGQIVKEVIFPPSSPLKSIPFDGCSAELSRDAQGRLLKLAEALQERPAMKIAAIGYVDQEKDEKACIERAAAEKAAAAKAAATAKTPGVPVTAPAAAAPPPSPPLEGEARLQQIALARAEAVRGFLVEQGKTDPSRVSARASDIHAMPTRKGDTRPRVEFTRASD
jgi:outer membrane protein OmpA-like peptidoglycan-associated protein